MAVAIRRGARAGFHAEAADRTGTGIPGGTDVSGGHSEDNVCPSSPEVEGRWPDKFPKMVKLGPKGRPEWQQSSALEQGQGAAAVAGSDGETRGVFVVETGSKAEIAWLERS